MKKYLSILVFAAIVAGTIVSCSQEQKAEVENPANQEEVEIVEIPEGVADVFSAGFEASEETKTYISIDEGDGVTYVPRWNSDDVIYVNGVASDGTVVRTDDNKKGSFTFASEVEAQGGKYYAVSPSMYSWDSENTRFTVQVNGTGAPQGYLKYQSTYLTYHKSTAFIAACSDTKSLTFKPLMAYYKLTINAGAGASANLKTIYIRQAGANPEIAGTWRVNFDGEGNPSMAPSTLSAILAYTCVHATQAPNGLELGSTVLIAIPAHNYSDGLILTVKDFDGKFQSFSIPSASADLSSKAGKIITKTLTFNPQSGTINNADEWNAFAAAVNGETNDWDLYKWVGNGTVKIGADFSAEDLTQITNLNYTIDGQGHTITRTTATGSLIGTITGEVKNLTLAGAIDASSAPQLGALADVLDAGGKITSVTNEMSITATAAANYAIGGIVRQIKGGIISGCENKGAIEANINVSAADYTLSIGGIVSGTSLTEAAVIQDCINNATITVTPTYANNTNYVKYGSLGGIIGAISSRDFNITLDNCDNKKTVAWEDPYEWTSPASSAGNAIGAPTAASIGGIVGRAAPVATGSNAPLLSTPNGTNGMDITFVNCDNTGAVRGRAVGNYGTVNANMDAIDTKMTQMHRKIYMGGLAGTLIGNSAKNITITDCTSSGSITPYSYASDTSVEPKIYSSNQCGISSVVGGLIGWGGYVSISGGSVSGTVGTKLRPAFCLGGVIGYAVRPFSISEMTVEIDGYLVPGKENAGGTALTDQNFAYFAAVPATFFNNNLSPAANITGSTITSCTVTGVIQTCDPQTFSSTGKQNGSGKHWADRASDSATNWVQGQGYTLSGVTIN